MAIVSIVDENGAPIDLSGVQAWDGEGGGLTPGNYLFEVQTVVQEASKQGKPQLVLDLIVVQGNETAVHDGSVTKHWLSLTSKSAGRLKNFLDAVGIVPGPQGFDDQELPGRQFWAEVFEQEYTPDPLNPTVKKTSTKIRKEVPVEGVNATAAAPAPAPAPAPAVASTPPRAPARASTPQLPPGPRGAVALPRPGQRIPMPGVKK